MINTKARPFFTAIILVIWPIVCFSQSSQLADSLNRRGMEFYVSGNYQQAEFYLREAFKLYEKNDPAATWLSPGIDYAEILVDRAKYKQALELFSRLNKVATVQNNIRARARIENDLGWLHNKKGASKKALYHLKEALPLAEQANDTLRIGYIYNNIGRIYYYQGDYQTSLRYRKLSLAYKEQTNDKNSISITLNNIGLIYEKLSLYDKSLKYYQQSLAIRKQLGNVDLMATATSNIGALYKRLGNLDLALVYYQQSLDYCRKAGNPFKTAQTLNNIGTLYNRLGQPHRALEYYRESMEVKKAFAGPGSMATSYRNIGSRLWDLGQFNEAKDYYQKALTLRKQAGNPIFVASSLLDLAYIELALGNFTGASTQLKAVAQIADSTQNKSLQTETRLLRGNIYFEQHHFEEALKAYNRSYVLSQSLTPNIQIPILQKLAYTYDQLGSAKAILSGQKAIALIENERAEAGPISKLKAGYFKQYTHFYIDLASWILTYKPKETYKAYHLVEAAKARSLTDELARAAQHIDESLPEEERVRRAQKISGISNLYASLKGMHDADGKTKIRDNIRQKELDYASYEHTLRAYYPQYQSLKNPEPISLKRAQELCDSKTAILEYAITSDKILIFFITAKKSVAKQVSIPNKNNPAGLSNLSNEISNFRSAIVSRAPIDSIRRLSEPLYKQLIAPFKRELTDYKNLIIVPDQTLAYLPFEALSNNTNYLISQYNIKYIPSITGFALLNSPKSNKNSLLAISNSSAKNTPLLPSTDTEIKSIAQLFSHPVMLKNKALAEDSVKSQMQKGYSFIHIASHSIIDAKNPSLSGIYLAESSPASNSKGDGFLRSSEIYGLHISCNLVVLSACESGLGKLVSGEGMLGLQRAFLNAGASTVVVSLWDVYDRPTAHFMPTFYKALMQNQDHSWYDMWISSLRWLGWNNSIPFGETANAMRQAKLRMLQNPRYNHPVYWAPFIVVGR